MDAEQAWQSALGQLQMEMPKASFDTWVRDTRIVSYNEGRFSIGVRNAYARDWLESRLSSTVTRLLMGMMNRSVDVEFLIAEQEESEPDSDDQTETQEKGIAADDDDASEDELLIEAHYDLAYDEIVTPDRVVVLPGYFRKHLSVIGPDLGWLYLAFRQAAYSAGGRSGTKRERFSGQIIAAWCGIVERTFWNWIGKDETWKQLRGLVATSASGPEWDTSSVTPRRLPRKYVVSMTLPLTAADASSLRFWLLAHLEELGGPEQALTVAAETPLAELLPANAPVGESPESITSILRGLFADTLSAERLVALSTRLQKHIMPDKDLLVVTHFFLQNILPYLGAGPGWILTLLRDRCWTDRASGETRTQVTVQGGYAEIAAWIGMTHGTVWRWLYGKHSASRGRSKPGAKGGEQRGAGRKATEIGKLVCPVLRVYLRETTSSKAPEFYTSPRSFDVLLEEIPAEIIEAALDEQAGVALDRAMTGEEDNLRAVCSIAKANSHIAEPDLRAVCSIGFARFADDNRAVCSIGFARFADHLRAVCRVFKALNLLKPNLLTSKRTNQPARGNSESLNDGNTQTGWSVALSFSDWDLEKLLETLNVNEKTRPRLREAHIPAWTIVAWLLRAINFRGVNPVSYALSRVFARETRHSAGKDFELLAKAPEMLLREIKRVLRPYRSLGEYSYDEYHTAYEREVGLSKPTAFALWVLLTGEKQCENVSVEWESVTTLTEIDPE